jgi:hypothetical protein
VRLYDRGLADDEIAALPAIEPPAAGLPRRKADLRPR